MKGQLPDAQGFCYCDKEGKRMSERQFYTYRDGSHPRMCKKCQTLHVDNFDPSTFLWLLQDADLPWVPSEWNTLRDRAFAKDPKKMNGMSVYGKYVAKMRLKKWKDYGWADSEMLQQQEGCRSAAAQQEKEAADAEFANELKIKLAEGEISEAEYKTLMPTQTQYKELDFTESAAIDAEVANPFQEAQFMNEDELPDPSRDLTKEDKIYLALKWGRLYKPSEWIALEKNYLDMVEAFGIEDPDTLNTLLLICKENLKMNQAIDVGDIDGALKHSRMYDALRKSANLTAVQNKKDKEEELNSVSQLVAYCEREKGRIPRIDITTPRDIVDKEILDNKGYLSSLVKEDPALAKEIEDYIKRKITEMEKKAAGKDPQEPDKISDEDISSYKAELQKQREEDEEMLRKEASK